MSPAIPDPRLNTAECVIKDHEPRELDTRHSNLIYSMLFCSFISVMLLGPLLAHFILEFLKNYPENTNSFCFWKEKPIVHAADSIVFVMLLIDIPFIIYTFAKSYKTELPMIFLIVFIGIITTEGPVIGLILKWKKYSRGKPGIDQDTKGDSSSNQDTEGGSSGNQDTEGGSGGSQDTEGGSSGNQDTEGGSSGDQDIEGGSSVDQGCNGGNQGHQEGNGGIQGTQGRNQDTMKRNKGVFCSLIYYISVNLLLYHFSWLLIGIMITPTWGLTVFLIILVFVISSFFLLWHLFLCASSQAFIFSGVCFFGFCSAAVVPVLAGQSFYGRETADDIIKVVLLYIITYWVPKILKFWGSLTSNQGEPPNPASSTISASGRTTNKDESTVPNARTTKNPSISRKANDGFELQKLGTREEERGSLLKNTKG